MSVEIANDNGKAPAPIVVAAVQFAPTLGDVEANVRQLDGLVERLQADLIVIPELASSGYFFVDREELRLVAEEPASGRFCSWARLLAERKGSVVVGGFPELDGERIFNSAVLALPDGSIHIYRKAHLFYKEKTVFDEGDSGFRVVEWNGVRYGVMICYDWRFPEACRTLALKGADIVLHPSNLVAAPDLWRPTMRTRSFENRVVTVTANRYGEEEREGEILRFTGESQIVDVNGALLAEAPSEGDAVIIASIDVQRARRKSVNDYNDIFVDRRPETYEL